MSIKGYYGGKHESAKTPGKMVREMVNSIKKDKFVKYIIVSEYDRFSRNAEQALGILNQLNAAGKVVVAAKTGGDTSTKEGFLMATISLGLAEWDNKNRVDKFISGRKDCLLKGVWAEKAPRGYTKEGKSKNSMCKLNDEGRLIRRAFLWKLEGTPNQEILSRLSNRHDLAVAGEESILPGAWDGAENVLKIIDESCGDKAQ
jgi:DNA invertase Pin-like site-specific DNA recombinase